MFYKYCGLNLNSTQFYDPILHKIARSDRIGFTIKSSIVTLSDIRQMLHNKNLLKENVIV